MHPAAARVHDQQLVACPRGGARRPSSAATAAGRWTVAAAGSRAEFRRAQDGAHRVRAVDALHAGREHAALRPRGGGDGGMLTSGAVRGAARSRLPGYVPATTRGWRFRAVAPARALKSLEAVATSRLLGCHATASTVLSCFFLMILPTHQLLSSCAGFAAAACPRLVPRGRRARAVQRARLVVAHADGLGAAADGEFSL